MEHVDLSYLVRLAGGNKQFVNEMISSFIEITPSYIREVKDQYDEKNWPGLQASAHRLKSAVIYFGINEITGIIEMIEEYAVEQIDQDNLLGLIAALNTIYDAALDELKRH